MKDPRGIRVCMIGDASVGKTSILNCLTEGSFNPLEKPTVGGNWQSVTFPVDGTELRLEIWDTAGQEKFRTLVPLFFRSAMGAIVTFDVTNRSSFQALEDWTRLFLQHVDPDPVIHVIGNKIDLEAARQVSRDEARLWAEGHGFCYFETSASTGTNVVEAFNSLSLAFSKKPGIAVVPNRSMAAEEDDHCC